MRARTVVITGASSGFGRGVALRMAEQGWNVVLGARRAAPLRALADQCGNALAVTVDVGNPRDVEKLARAAIAEFDGFDAWINNAGVAALGPFERVPVEDHLRVVQTNLCGTIAGSHVALRHFRDRGAGTLVNIASLLGRTPAPYYASYCASKYGVVGLCDALRQELAAARQPGIRVCAVLPMAADTPFYDHAANYTGHTLQPFPITNAEEVIDAIVALLDAPRDEITVGLSAAAAMVAERVSHAFTHGMTGAVTQSLQMERAPAAPIATGNLHAPVAVGTGVHGSILQRLDTERQSARH